MPRPVDQSRIDKILFVAYGLDEFTVGQLSDKSDERPTIVKRLVHKKVEAGELIRVSEGKRSNPARYRWAPDDR